MNAVLYGGIHAFVLDAHLGGHDQVVSRCIVLDQGCPDDVL